jgi:hypothetical protein
MMFNIYLFQALELLIFYHGETAKRIDRRNTLRYWRHQLKQNI